MGMRSVVIENRLSDLWEGLCGIQLVLLLIELY